MFDDRSNANATESNGLNLSFGIRGIVEQGLMNPFITSRIQQFSFLQQNRPPAVDQHSIIINSILTAMPKLYEGCKKLLKALD